MSKFFQISFVIFGIIVMAGCQQRTAEQSALPPDHPTIILEEGQADNPENGLISSAESSEGLSTVPMEDPTAQQDTSAMIPTTGDLEIPGPYVKPTIEQIQQALQNAQLYEGKIDGALGPKTKKAIRIFQEQNDLAIDGKVGPKTWKKLAPYLQQIKQGQSAVNQYQSGYSAVDSN